MSIKMMFENVSHQNLQEFLDLKLHQFSSKFKLVTSGILVHKEL